MPPQEPKNRVLTGKERVPYPKPGEPINKALHGDLGVPIIVGSEYQQSKEDPKANRWEAAQRAKARVKGEKYVKKPMPPQGKDPY